MTTRLIILYICFIQIAGIAQETCDSISFYENGKVAYLRLKDRYGYSSYQWHKNGHIQLRITDKSHHYSRTENYEDGSVKFDTASTDMNSVSEFFYKSGTLQRRVVEFKSTSSYFKSDPPYSRYDFDSVGKVSLIVKKDMTGRVAVNERYPFEKFETLKKHVTLYPDKSLKQYGYYIIATSGDTLKCSAWFTYYSNKQLAGAGLFVDNMPRGLHLTYDSTGAITSRKYFVNGSETNAFDSRFDKEKSFIIGQYHDRDGIDSTERMYSRHKEYDMYYYYKGLPICEVPDPRKVKDSSLQISLIFPIFEYFSAHDHLRIDYYKHFDLSRKTEYITGQIANKWEDNGKAKTHTHVIANNKAYGYSSLSQLKLKWHEYTDTTGHLFVTLPCGKKIELIDRKVKINGYWEFITANGIKVFEGLYNYEQQGRWIEYYPQTGYPYIIQNVGYRANAKGVYKEYYRNGKLKIIGKYNKNNKRTGIWEEYTDKGQKTDHARFINDRQYGVVIYGNGNTKWNGKESRSVNLYWNSRRLFRAKSKNRPPKF